MRFDRSTTAPFTSLRRAVAGMAVVAALLLVGSVTLDWSGLRRLETAAVGGQLHLVRTGMQRIAPAMGGPPSQELLEEAVAELEQAGLRAAVALDREGVVLAAAGSPIGVEPVDYSGRPQFLGSGLVRQYARPPMRGPAGEIPRGGIVFEVEPLLAKDLRWRTLRSLIVGYGVAGALLLGAVVFWRLSQRAEQMSVQLARDDRLAALGEMSALLAHELRNPLASLKGNAQLLVELLKEDPDARACSTWVVEEAVRLEKITNSLLDFARSGSLDRESSDPVELARDVARELEPQVVVLHTEASPTRWDLDPLRCHQALSNLVGNAAQACQDPPPELTVRQQGDTLVFEVRDHGAGLQGEDAEALFEAFRTSRTRGTGLGLAVVHRIAVLHGGRVTAADHPDGGALFVLMIPEESG